MPQFWSVRHAVPVASLAMAVGFFGGCSGQSEPTAAFPEVKPRVAVPKAVTTPPKGSDRVGSEAGVPNP